MLDENAQKFLQHLLLERRYSTNTVRNYKQALERFTQWLSQNSNKPILCVTLTDLRSFVIEAQRDLSRRSLHLAISALRGFYQYALKQNWLQHDPTGGLILPKLKKALPLFLSQKQMLDLLNAPERLQKEGKINSFLAKRDSAILEVLYGGGLRISELVGLCWSCIDWGLGSAKVLGKGQKERVAPLGIVALEHLRSLKDEYFESCEISQKVFTDIRGKSITARHVQLQLKLYLQAAGLSSEITPHKIRHSYATHLLSNGADLRTLQELMGHASLSTTQIYTHTDMVRLKQAHLESHPRS